MSDVSPLEVVSRLSIASTYRTPGWGHSTSVPEVGRPELAGAVGYVREKLEADVALAVATHCVLPWPRIAALAHEPLRRHLQSLRITSHMVAGPKAARAQLVLHDAFFDLTLLRRGRDHRRAARRVRMRRADYVELHREITSWLLMLAHNGARSAMDRLYGER